MYKLPAVIFETFFKKVNQRFVESLMVVITKLSR